MPRYVIEGDAKRKLKPLAPELVQVLSKVNLPLSLINQNLARMSKERISSQKLELVATLLAVIIGIPQGILAARCDRVRAVLMLFGLSKVQAILATVLYATPPLIRLIDLGIRQMDKEVMESVTAFDANRWQKLFGFQLPLALPSIMAGINQTTMMSL
ncbi:ABC transporter permease subunit [Serratia liquefaciens]|uniref:ABC transporter permease subunit n=1 Tax=Serratia liquefaciens TaxID=614 RepID=UPI002179BE8A|nr:ABC transporter permease subunit [Serratia liquefaciens]CAI1062905.1 Glycine betaine/L-proline transport system permease protein proW [Serratia liquefaciens]CAI1067756.1 Glycine betaine/L-proline transport system permease protein proW [Serratia liquefaciens]